MTVIQKVDNKCIDLYSASFKILCSYMYFQKLKLMYCQLLPTFCTATEWPPIGKIAAHSAYDMFSWYKYLIVNLVFSHLSFWSGNLFMIAPFPDHCLLVPFVTNAMRVS